MTKTENFLRFLTHISKQSKFCIKELAQTLNVSEKTIQRYKKEIESHLGITFESYQKGCYLALDTSKIKQILLNPDDMEAAAKLAEIIVLLEKKNLEIFGLDEELTKTFKNDVYHLKEYPFEELKNHHIKKIKEAIIYRKYADIRYEADRNFHFKNTKPLKLVFAEGNWYLALMTEDEVNHGFKFLRINFIKDIQIKPKTFKRDHEALRFIENFRTLFSSFQEPDFEVRVKVDSEVARFFKVKKFISSQKILEELEDGSLILSYTINNDKEILHIAKHWLPHMKILSPAYLQKQLEKMCTDFLEKAQ